MKPLGNGDRIILRNLTNEQYNHLTARISRYYPKLNRFAVQLDVTETTTTLDIANKIIVVKPENMFRLNVTSSFFCKFKKKSVYF